jgi:NADH:ubiquinone oxidoreductase subunit E
MKSEIDILEVDRIVADVGRGAASVIPVLQSVQKTFNYLPEEALRRVCEISDITPAQIEGVSSFFSQFRRTPVGKHMIRVCDGTACHVKGSEAVYKSVLHGLGIEEGDTDAAGLFTVQKVACLGCCTLAPAVQIDETTYGHVKTDTVSDMIADFLDNEANRVPRTVREEGEGLSMGEVRVGLGSCCVAGGSARIKDALEDKLESLNCKVDIKPVGCVGMCHRTPLVEVIIPGEEPVLYAKVKPEDIPEIVEKHFWSDSPFIKVRTATENLLKKLYSDAARNVPERHELNVRDEPVTDFLGRQQHIATEHCGVLNPSDMDEYKRLGGFQALKDVLFKNDPDNLISSIDKSGLRGRGGGGFKTATKWGIVRKAPGEKKIHHPQWR